jgi:amino acid permease
MSTRRDHPVLEALGLIVLFGAMVAVAPGALLTQVFEHLVRARLDAGQRWTWAIASSAVIACAMAWRSRSAADGFGRYMLVAVTVSAVVLVARFGMHERWASEMLRAYAP